MISKINKVRRVNTSLRRSRRKLRAEYWLSYGPQQLKKEVITLVLVKGQPRAFVCEKFKVPESTLRGWLNSTLAKQIRERAGKNSTPKRPSQEIRHLASPRRLFDVDSVVAEEKEEPKPVSLMSSWDWLLSYASQEFEKICNLDDDLKEEQRVMTPWECLVSYAASEYSQILRT